MYSEPSDDGRFSACFVITSLLDPADKAPSTGFTVDINGDISTKRLETAIQSVVSSNPVLRSRYQLQPSDTENLVYKQTCEAVTSPVFNVVDIASGPTSEDYVECLTNELVCRAYDVSSEPLFRCVLIRMAGRKSRLVLAAHHSIVDGRSLNLLAGRIIEVYCAKKAGVYSEASAASCQLPALIAYNPGNKKEGTVVAGLIQQGSGLCLALPEGNLGTYSRNYDKETSQRIRRYCKVHGLTVSLYFKILYSLIIKLYAQASEDFLFTEVMGDRSNRNQDAIGCFIKKALWSIPASLHSDASCTLEDYFLWFKAWQHKIKHQELYITPGQSSQIQHEGIEFSFNFYRYLPLPKDDELELELELEFEGRGIATPLTNSVQLIVTENPEGTFTTTFCGDSWCESTGILQRLKAVGDQLLSGHVNYLQQLSWVDDAEWVQINSEWNNTDHCFDLSLSLTERFESQVSENPDAIAIVDDEASYTYRELNNYANQIANKLILSGLRKGDYVCLSYPRSRQYLAIMLGILKSGGVYIPVDPACPAERSHQIVASCLPSFYIGERFPDRSRVDPGDVSKAILPISSDFNASISMTDPELAIDPEDPAYVIFTSGSTGQPKGAMIHHAGMMNHISAELLDLDLKGPLVMLQSAPVTSDISVWQFLGPVVDGGTCVVLTDSFDVAAMYRLMKAYSVNLIELVPVVLESLYEHLQEFRWDLPATLQKVMVTGEAVSARQINQWLSKYPDVPVINAYGPSEASDDVIQHTFRELLDEEEKHTAIGRPLANLKAYIVDDSFRLLPPGIPGEICIGGIGVGLGYLHNEALTSQVFVDNPFGEGKLYKTGDIGYWDDIGTIYYINRRDFQVQINGLRVEPGEIEHAITSIPGIKRSVVITDRTDNGQEQLIGYYQASRRVEARQIKQHLRAKLPSHMVPDQLIHVASFNYTANGKIDRKKLPACRDILKPCAPENPLEEELLSLWQTLLKQETISTTDNFLRLGGNSLTATRIANRLSNRYPVTVRDVLRHLTIKELACHLQSKQNSRTLSRKRVG